MAKLEAPSGGTGLQIEDLPPPNQYVAVCLRVNDLFDQERPTFENPKETEIKDVTRFIFGVKDQQGNLYLVQTFEFTISGAPGSNLVKFLTAWLGQSPAMGWDYSEMRGRGAMITIQHKQSRANPGKTYANISGIAPVFQQLAHLIPNAAEFEPKLQVLENATPQQRQQGTPAPRPPGAGYGTPAPGQSTPPPAQASAPQLSPDGKWQLVNGQWVPHNVQTTPPPPQQVPPPPPPPAPAQTTPPPAPPAPPVAAPQLSPDGKWQLVDNQWIPYPSINPVGTSGIRGQFTPPTGLDEDVPF